jgi:hypothetical protein
MFSVPVMLTLLTLGIALAIPNVSVPAVMVVAPV